MTHHENEDLKWYEKLSHKIEDKMQLLVWIFIFALIGGLVEIPPFFLMGEVKGPVSIIPYNALELAGRDVYQEEGCFYCHTQMIRPFKWETDRWDRNREYGPEPYSKAYEYVYEHPFLWGSKRTGPDLWHEYSLNNNASWQKTHLINPQETSPGSIMPAYPHLFETPVDIEQTKANMRALKAIGVPYTDEDIAKADQLLQGKTKGDALVAYLLKLGRDTIQK
mgnify:CR=1 FL=1